MWLFYCDVNEFYILIKNVLNAIKLIKFSNSFITNEKEFSACFPTRLQ